MSVFEMKTIRTTLHLAQRYVSSGEAEILLSYLVEKPREFVIAHPELHIGSWVYVKFLRRVKKRKAGVPLAYLTNHKEFYGLDFLVNRRVLVPRPETELIVDLALKEIQKTQNSTATVIDIGTGSGCIPIALGENVCRNTINFLATDISGPALRVAKKNTTRHAVPIDFLHGSLLEPVIKKYPQLLKEKNNHLIITANLPYLTKAQRDAEPTIQYEPESAFVAADDGLQLYKELLQQIKKFCSPEKHTTAFFEIDPSQSAALSSYTRTLSPSAVVQVHKDLAKRDRVLEVHLH